MVRKQPKAKTKTLSKSSKQRPVLRRNNSGSSVDLAPPKNLRRRSDSSGRKKKKIASRTAPVPRKVKIRTPSPEKNKRPRRPSLPPGSKINRRNNNTAKRIPQEIKKKRSNSWGDETTDNFALLLEQMNIKSPRGESVEMGTCDSITFLLLKIVGKMSIQPSSVQAKSLEKEMMDLLSQLPSLNAKFTPLEPARHIPTAMNHVVRYIKEDLRSELSGIFDALKIDESIFLELRFWMNTISLDLICFFFF